MERPHGPDRNIGWFFPIFMAILIIAIIVGILNFFHFAGKDSNEVQEAQDLELNVRMPCTYTIKEGSVLSQLEIDTKIKAYRNAPAGNKPVDVTLECLQ